MISNMFATSLTDHSQFPKCWQLRVTLPGIGTIRCSAFGRNLNEALERLLEKHPEAVDFDVLTPK